MNKHETRMNTMINVIEEHGCIQQEKVTEFAEKARAFIDRYDYVEVRFIGLNHMGSYLHWITAVNRCGKDTGTYYLFCNYPADGLSWLGVNPSITEKLDLEGISVVSNHNVDFWKYMMHNYRSLFVYITDYINENEIGNRQYMNGHIDFNRSYVYYSPEEEQELERKKQELGIGDKYICISVRDSSYTRDILRRDDACFKQEIGDAYRNGDITSFRKVADYYRKKGYQLVRMGAKVEEKFDYPGVIDYAVMDRNEEMDLYITKGADFFISDQSGIQALPLLVCVPIVYYNAQCFLLANDLGVAGDKTRDLIIYKKFFDEKTKSILPLRKVLEIEKEALEVAVMTNSPSNYVTYEIYDKLGIRCIDNTPEEILSVSVEMYEWLKGSQNNNQAYYDRERIHNEIKKSFYSFGYTDVGVRIGEQYLLENEWLVS